jgi:hypothetical protein
MIADALTKALKADSQQYFKREFADLYHKKSVNMIVRRDRFASLHVVSKRHS